MVSISPTRMGMVLAVAALLSLLVGVVLLLAGLKGVVLTGDWARRNCTLLRVEEQMRISTDPLVMPRGGLVALDAAVYFAWDVQGSVGDGYLAAAGPDVSFSEARALAFPQQRMGMWEELSRSNDRQVQVFSQGAKWPNIKMVETWYQTLPVCENGVRCGASEVYTPVLDATSRVVVEPSTSLLSHKKLELRMNETVPCYAKPGCVPPCSVLLSNPQATKSKAEHAIITGMAIIILVVCFSPVMQGWARRHTCTFHTTASSVCSRIVTITDNPEERTPLFRHQA